MAKSRTVYSCTECGSSNPKWLGRCPTCEAWNSLVEEKKTAAPAETSLSALRNEFRAPRESAFKETGLDAADLVSGRNASSGGYEALEEETTADGKSSRCSRRYKTGMLELDRVLGGGLVTDSFVLIGGDPGIGKSTLLLQAARALVTHQPELKVLYVSGEESIDQIRSRAHRLNVKSKQQIYLAAETELERAFAMVKELEPHVLIMDSLQTFASAYSESAPGSVSQVREIASRLMALAKSGGVAVWLVGHVTKDGSIAGPKVVEHLVDTVLYFEGESGQNYRLLRTVKNRFGSSQELGVFEMESTGLSEVLNPSALFLGERSGSVEGTAVTASLEGSRPLLVELQALVAPSALAIPRRTSVGYDGGRLALISAILERHLKLSLANQDLYFNVAGGLRLNEPACDLAAAAAICSSACDVPIPAGWVFLGELGLTGEVRRVAQPDVRIEEAKKLGFHTVVLPKANFARLSKEVIAGVTLQSTERVTDLQRLLGGTRPQPKPRKQSEATQ